MIDPDRIKFDLVKLLGGGRLLRLTDPHSGLTLEKTLTSTEAVVRQQERLLRALDSALARLEATPGYGLVCGIGQTPAAPAADSKA